MVISKKTKIIIGIFVLLFLSIGTAISIYVLQQQQDARSRAAASTTFSLIPRPGPGNAITTAVGSEIPIDVVVTPGTNNVVTMKIDIQYDPTLLEPADNFFALSTNFLLDHSPETLIPLTVNNGAASIYVSTGFNYTKSVNVPTTIGTFTFKAIGATPENTPTLVSFTDNALATSINSNDQFAEDVLQNGYPAEITIGSGGVNLGETPLSFTILLHGVGEAGDTPNPEEHDLSNKTPEHPQRTLVVELFDNNDQLATSAAGLIEYNPEEGWFEGTIGVPGLIAGNYTVKIKTDRYLRKEFPGIILLTDNQENILPLITLVAGDTNGDNSLDVLDYNALLDCGYGALNSLPITNNTGEYNSFNCKNHEPRINIDIDDNGFVNAFDYNLFVREFSVQSGD